VRIALLLLAIGIGIPLVAAVVILVRYERWWTRETTGTAFFGRTSTERRAFAAEAKQRGRLAASLLVALTRVVGRRLPNGVDFNGTTAPPQCNRADFVRAVEYRPEAGDVFVVTQMKCGTTWMQQIVYEILMRGHGDLSDRGARHIYAVSPWIESSWAVPLEQAPRLGAQKMRVIKSHMPAKLLPIGDRARYVYVTRHPAACFASCADFIDMLIGPIAPPRERLVEWFCSDRMWWGSWPDHVESWWRATQKHPNVLFVHFEEMRADLGTIVDRVAGLLGASLTAEERETVIRKCGFDYMKEHEDRFTMAPPGAFTKDDSFLRSGSTERHRDVGAGERERIAAFCRERLRGGTYPVERFYKDLA
jgi:hypothetical protein